VLSYVVAFTIPGMRASDSLAWMNANAASQLCTYNRVPRQSMSACGARKHGAWSLIRYVTRRVWQRGLAEPGRRRSRCLPGVDPGVKCTFEALGAAHVSGCLLFSVAGVLKERVARLARETESVISSGTLGQRRCARSAHLVCYPPSVNHSCL